jgi:Ca2+-binding RTX toxin-like protein
MPATLDVTNGVLSYLAAPGENNALTITSDVDLIVGPNGVTAATVFQFHDNGAGITLSPNALRNGWVQIDAHTVQGTDLAGGVPAGASGLAMSVDLGDGKDILNVQSFNSYGDGSDSLTINRSGGGTDAIILGGNGNAASGSITSPLTINGGATTTLTVDDSANTDDQNWTVGADSLGGFNDPVAYTNLSDLTILGGSGNNTFAVSAPGLPTNLSSLGSQVVSVQNPLAPLTITGTTGAAYDVSFSGSTDYVTVTGTAGGSTPLSILGGGGTDRVTIGGASGGVQGVQGPVSVANPAPGGSLILIVDDSGDTLPEQPTLTGTSITGLAPAAISYTPDNLVSLTILGSSGSNRLTVADTSAPTTFQDSSHGDTVFVQGTTAPLTLLGGGATESVTLGNSGGANNTLTAVGGSVTVQDVGALTADDSADTVGQNATIGAGSISGLAAAPISFSGIGTLTLIGGQGSNTFTVADTVSGTTVLNSNSAGLDTVVVQATTNPLTISGHGADAIGVGNAGTVQEILGSVTINGAQSLVVDDSADATARGNAAAPVLLASGSVTGLAPAAIEFPGGHLSALTILGGTGGNTFTVQGTAAATVLNSGSGNDTINVLAAANTLSIDGQAGTNQVTLGAGVLSAITGPVTLSSSGGGSTSLTVDDHLDPAAQFWTVGASSLSATALAGGLRYQGLAQLALRLGSGAGTVDVSGFTGNASLTGNGVSGPHGDTLVSTNDADFTLSDTLLTRSGSSSASIALSGFSAGWLTGGAGANTLDASGFSGSATLDGGAGNDTLAGGSGHDVLIGGSGVNRLVGGSGISTVTETADDNFTLTNTGLTGKGGTGITDVLVNIHSASLADPNTAANAPGRRFNASTFRGNVTLQGGAGNDTLLGGLGNDVLSGGLGSNTLAGGAGSNTVLEAQDVSFTLSSTALLGMTTRTVLRDALSGIQLANLTDTNATGTGRILNTKAFAGSVTLVGGAGSDTFIVGPGSGSVDGGAGTNTLVASGTTNFTLGDASLAGSHGFNDRLANIQRARLTIAAGNHWINASGFTGNATLQGGAGNDTLVGGSGDDSLSSGAGRNVLVGGAGKDVLVGGSGRNLLIGGGGNDSLVAGSGGSILLAGTTAFDTQTAGGNFQAVNAIMAEWTSADSYAVRVARLSGAQAGGKNATTFLNSSTVSAGATEMDSLVGGTGMDWFFATSADRVTHSAAETVTGIP